MGIVWYAHMDYTRDPFSRWQWTFDKSAAGVLVQLLGILITISLAQLWILVQSIWFVKERVQPSEQRESQAASSVSRKPRSLWEIILVQLREALDEFSPPVQLPGAPPEPRWRVFSLKAFLVLFAFVLLAGILALGVVSNALQGDSKVLTTSPLCGYYMKPPLNFAQAALFETRAQSDAQQYAQLCFGGRTLDYGCDQFSQQSISYDTNFNDTCPFGEGMCHLGPQGAITFTTGPTPASALGINAKHTLQFERTTTCAPIIMNSTYITHEIWRIDDEVTHHIFLYHYGWSNLIGKDGVSWVLSTYGKIVENKPFYDVFAQSQDSEQTDKATSPLIAIPALSTPPGTVLTLLYINPGRILYLAPSNDPIFPATRHTTISGVVDVWERDDEYARVLACVDHNLWRDLEEGPEWHNRKQNPTEPPQQIVGAKWLLFLALQTSNIYETISERQGAALNASSLLGSYTSLPLDPKQWEIEARYMFEISLARMQFEASYIAHGTYASYPGYIKQSPKIVAPKMCHHTYITNDPDFSNINGIVYVMILVPCLTIIILSCPCNEILLWEWILGEDRAENLSEQVTYGIQAVGAGFQKVLWYLWKAVIGFCSKGYQVINQFAWWVRRQPAAIRYGNVIGTSTVNWVKRLLRTRS